MRELEISPEELIREVERGVPFHVLDVRAPERLAAGRIELVPPDRFHNARGSQVLASHDPEALGLDRTAPLAVVCGRGNDSLRVAAFLAERGFVARSLAGGLLRWMATQVPREVAPGHCDRVVQLDRVGKGALAYLLASAGEALIVDPPRHLGPLVDLLERYELRLVGVAETHVHADFLSGAAALAARYGVPHHLHGSDLVLPYDGRRGTLPIADFAGADRLRFGAVELEVEWTPGHTEGSVSIRAGREFVLSGDFVFLESVGRPDLGGRTAAWTDQLFDSLEQVRARWPGALRVLPAHYAAERERGPDGAVEARFGELAARNPPLRIRDREQFRAWVASRGEPVPEAYRRIKAANLGLEQPGAAEADELEGGRNRCAI